MTLTREQALAPYLEPERVTLTAATQVERFRKRRRVKLDKREMFRAIRRQPKLEAGEDDGSHHISRKPYPKGSAAYNAKHIEALAYRIARLEAELP